LGYLTPTNITSNRTGVNIPTAAISQTAYRLWSNGSGGTEYFLIENRQKTGYDTYLPGAGLLIWHVDENRSGNSAECKQINNWQCGSNHYRVALEQADNQLDLENKSNRGDSGDPFPGSATKRTFTFTTAPNSSSYASSANTLIGVTNIGDSGSTMTADFQVQ
jgi:immune inhibitor A